MKIIERYMRYAIVQNQNTFTVFGREPREMKSFDNETDARAYYNELINPTLVALANAPSWD